MAQPHCRVPTSWYNNNGGPLVLVPPPLPPDPPRRCRARRVNDGRGGGRGPWARRPPGRPRLLEDRDGDAGAVRARHHPDAGPGRAAPQQGVLRGAGAGRREVRRRRVLPPPLGRRLPPRRQPHLWLALRRCCLGPMQLLLLSSGTQEVLNNAMHAATTTPKCVCVFRLENE